MEVCPHSGQEMVREELGLKVLDFFMDFQMLRENYLGDQFHRQEVQKVCRQGSSCKWTVVHGVLNHYPGLAYLGLCVQLLKESTHKNIALDVFIH